MKRTPLKRISKKQRNREADLARKKKILLKDFDGYCPMCGETGRKMELDHIIKRGQCGSDDLDNLRLICIICNRSR